MTNPHFFWDVWKFLLVTGDPKSWRDAIGRLMEWLYANGKFNEKNEALESCLEFKENGKYVLYRHPIYKGYKADLPLEQYILSIVPDPAKYQLDKPNEIYASRDHWSYFIQYKKNTLSKEDFADFISKVPRMRGMNLWMGTMKGNKWKEWWYYTIFNPGAYIGNIISNLIIWIGKLGPEESLLWWIENPTTTVTIDFDDLGLIDSSKPIRIRSIDGANKGTVMQLRMTKWQKTWQRIWTVVMPFYPIQNRAWQLKWLPDSKRKERQKRILLRRTDRGNYIVRALFGDAHISDIELQKYPEVTGDRSGVKLSKACDREIKKIHNTENCYKKKLAWKLHNENING